MNPGYGHGAPQLPFPPARPRQNLSGGALWMIGVAFSLTISVGASLIPRLINGGSSSIQRALGDVGGGKLPTLPTLSSISWSSAEPGCLIDANGDGVLDMAGLSGEKEPNQATVVDGSSGKVLFTSPPVAKAVQLGCLGESGFFVAEGNFQLDFFTARSPWGKTSVMARDKVSAYGVGAGCVQLRIDDGTSMGVQLPSGVATTCPITILHSRGRREPGMMGLTDKSTELEVGTRKYSLTVRPSGTEILTLHVSEAGKEISSQELPYASCTFGAAIAVGAGKILLWAAQPSERDKGLLIALDETSGKQLYELPIPDTSSDSPELFKFNGKYVLAVNWGALRAYEPATGAEAWRVGR
jgi:outer membrane protein assembly factor BamB